MIWLPLQTSMMSGGVAQQDSTTQFLKTLAVDNLVSKEWHCDDRHTVANCFATTVLTTMSHEQVGALQHSLLVHGYADDHIRWNVYVVENPHDSAIFRNLGREALSQGDGKRYGGHGGGNLAELAVEVLDRSTECGKEGSGGHRAQADVDEPPAFRTRHQLMELCIASGLTNRPGPSGRWPPIAECVLRELVVPPVPSPRRPHDVEARIVRVAVVVVELDAICCLQGRGSGI
mmetsp:Transcript_46370/g.117753  ORF Transcript_46370/g.117753 Transcript_46370/m.117753 type:complete len:232 (+) Transcript_46370:363-1058(+)